MDTRFLIRFAQAHETFRRPELDALATLYGYELQWIHYAQDSPFAIIALHPSTTEAAVRLISRSVLVLSIHEFWARGETYDQLHECIKKETKALWPRYKECSFKFDVDSFRASRPAAGKFNIVESFSYMPFHGPIIMNKPEQVFTVFEEYGSGSPQPHMLFFGRRIAEAGRKLVHEYDLKKRRYIATTSMDAELSLLTANLALAAPGKLAYDPFMGTGSFPVCCAAFGAVTIGSDLDGRSVRGKADRNVASNFQQYGTTSLYLGGCAADLTNTPMHDRPVFDIVICDPPYGVREGLKVLGHVKERLRTEVILQDGMPAHLQEDYVPPKRPYSFVRMLDDILDFSAARLVPGGRLCMWMPVAKAPEGSGNDAELQAIGTEAAGTAASQNPDFDIPQHPGLKLIDVCQQDFNKWSRRLLMYSRLRSGDVDAQALIQYQQFRKAIAESGDEGHTADSLNRFRKLYFQKFKE